ncbi:MAG: hypothetical protein KatS3mg014_1724 [Actinomycetota bacterium]|nr:MAG: hypothetical protein KatS3mg014_1724 [Actinomycetota bacterium]
MPSQRLRPALPREISSCSALPTSPTVALQVGVHHPHLARRAAAASRSPLLGHDLDARAGRARQLGRRRPASAPRRGPCVPIGMFRSGRALPGRMSASSPGHHAGPRPQSRSARGCSASRRRRSGAARSAPLRFGSYSIARHLRRARRPCPAEVDDAVAALVAAALVPRGDPPVLVPAAASCAPWPSSDFSGGRSGDLLEVGARSRPVGPASSACTCGSPSSLTPSRRSRSTRPARAHDGPLLVRALARVHPPALHLAAHDGRVHVETTRTPKSASTACLISVLLARGSTRNVYAFRSLPA